MSVSGRSPQLEGPSATPPAFSRSLVDRPVHVGTGELFAGPFGLVWMFPPGVERVNDRVSDPKRTRQSYHLSTPSAVEEVTAELPMLALSSQEVADRMIHRFGLGGVDSRYAGNDGESSGNLGGKNSGVRNPECTHPGVALR